MTHISVHFLVCEYSLQGIYICASASYAVPRARAVELLWGNEKQVYDQNSNNVLRLSPAVGVTFEIKPKMRVECLSNHPKDLINSSCF